MLRRSKRLRSLTQNAENAQAGPVAHFHHATLADLPVELLLHIASTFIILTVPLRNQTRWNFDPELYIERRNSLRALSQTSSTLRRVFLPLAWQWHVFAADVSHCQKEKLERVCKGLLENPVLAAHIRTAAIIVEDRDQPECLIHCLHSLHNLHTLCFMTSAYSDAIARAVLPQVHTVVLPACAAYYFIPCFPKVKAVISNGRIKGYSDLQDLFDEDEKSLEELDGFTLNQAGIKYIVGVAPNLRRIAFSEWIPKETIQLLHPLTKLQCLSMSAFQISERRHRSSPKSKAELDEWIATAISVMQGDHRTVEMAGGRKRVKLHYKWKDYVHRDEDEENNTPKVVERIEDVEVE